MPLFVPRRPLMAAPSTLYDNLVAYWKLDEASDGSGAVTRVDATGRGNDLTDNNTVASAAGKLGNAASFATANSEYFSKTDTADLSTGNIDFMFAHWFYVSDATLTQAFISKSTGANTLEYLLRPTGSKIAWGVGNGINGQYSFITHTTIFSNDTWYLVFAWYQQSDTKLYVQLNDDTPQASAAVSYTPADTSLAFYLGSFSGLYNYLGGRMDAVGIWKRVLTAAERAEYYNGGAGVELF